jgi:hypothetical protein
MLGYFSDPSSFSPFTRLVPPFSHPILYLLGPPALVVPVVSFYLALIFVRTFRKAERLRLYTSARCVGPERGSQHSKEVAEAIRVRSGVTGAQEIFAVALLRTLCFKGCNGWYRLSEEGWVISSAAAGARHIANHCWQRSLVPVAGTLVFLLLARLPPCVSQRTNCNVRHAYCLL